MKTFLQLGFILIVASALLYGCTENQRARSFGGSMTIELPQGTDFVDATWKGETLWYITTPRPADGTVETYTFQEKSMHGIIEGEVIFVEQ